MDTVDRAIQRRQVEDIKAIRKSFSLEDAEEIIRMIVLGYSVDAAIQAILE